MKIAIETNDGGVAIMTIVPGADPEECVRKWKELHADIYVSHHAIAANKVPQNREHRAAWKLSGNKSAVELDPVRKKAIDDAKAGK